MPDNNDTLPHNSKGLFRTLWSGLTNYAEAFESSGNTTKNLMGLADEAISYGSAALSQELKELETS